GYLKFSAKGTKREVFRMLIPGSLITTDIREASHYPEYLANVTKHRSLNQRDLPRDNLLVRVEVLRKIKKEKSKNKGRVPTEMELELEHTQQCSSYEVSWACNSLVHSSRALSALRRSGLRTASTAAKPCQEDSSEFYLIVGSIHTDQRGTVVLATLFNRNSATLKYAVMIQDSVGMRVLKSQLHKMAILHSKDDYEMYCG
nr:hypothetical protein [Tanacetum cinerariifolium]